MNSMDNGFLELSFDEMIVVEGGDIDWEEVKTSAALSAAISGPIMGAAGAGCGTIACPVVGTVSVGFVCFVSGVVGGAVYGAGKSILNQTF